MLSKLKIQGFQSWEDFEFEFHPGVNCLIGTSNAGKSAVLRGIHWVCKNRPLGSNFIRKGFKEAYVNTVWDREEQIIEVGRKKNTATNENLYELTGHDDFTSPGTSPPQAIIDALNLSDINVQEQFSPYLLVFDSPGAVATYIRKVTGLADIEAIKDKLASKERKNKLAQSSKKEDLDSVEEKLKEIESIPLDKLETNINLAEKLMARSVELARSRDRLENLCCQMKRLESERIDIPEERFNQIKLEIEAVSKTYLENTQKRDKLSLMIESWEQLESKKVSIPEEEFDRIQIEILETSKNLDRNTVRSINLTDKLSIWIQLENQKINISLDIPDFNLDIVVDRYGRSCKDLVRLGTLITEMLDFQKEADEAQEQLEAYVLEEKALYAEVKVCPECSSVLTEDTRRVLLEKRQCC